MNRPSKSGAVGVRELRQNLSVYLRRVQRGETLTVTERRRVVAVLGPAARGEDAVDQLIAERRAAAPARELSKLPRPLRLTTAPPLGAILDDLGRDKI